MGRTWEEMKEEKIMTRIYYMKNYFQNKQKTNIVYSRRQSWVKDGGSDLEGGGEVLGAPSGSVQLILRK